MMITGHYFLRLSKIGVYYLKLGLIKKYLHVDYSIKMFRCLHRSRYECMINKNNVDVYISISTYLYKLMGEELR